ncbi:hypothetical protein [Roseococcus pinisoli]|uniref:Terminase small subunit n=1 Tax=Roseococcus pinisoli TaxID=2835040 RepID=A0ABS5QH54_9PROT|nr:hypothetical protein [Roseococcus pinisoli]MBS7812882.1 hypothetical protein [Roseococcus pinisoli]
MSSQSDVARHLLLDQSSVSKLIASGILPRAARGALDLDACRDAYIRHLRDAAAGRGTASEEDSGQLTTERIRYARAQADALQLKNDLAMRRVAPVDVMVDMVTLTFRSVRNKFLAIPSTDSPAIFQCKTVGQVFALLTQHIHEAMEGISRGGTDDAFGDPSSSKEGGGVSPDDAGAPAAPGRRGRRNR